MAYLEITLQVAAENRRAAVGVYQRYKETSLTEIAGASSKELLIRDNDVQVLHGFNSVDDAKAHLESALFNDDVATGLKRLLTAAPDIRIYAVA